MPINDEEARRRIKIIRLAFCERDAKGAPESAKAFAARLGIESTAWNNFEMRTRPGRLALAFEQGIDHIKGVKQDLPPVLPLWKFRHNLNRVPLQ